MSFGRSGREIPRLFILVIRVVRFSPSRAAAPWGPPTTQSVAFNVCKIKARSKSFKVCPADVTAGVFGTTGFASNEGKGSRSTWLFERMTAGSKFLDASPAEVRATGVLSVEKGFGSTPLSEQITARSIRF